MLANSPQTRLDITQTQQIARNCGLSLQTACTRQVWGTASGGPYHSGGVGGGYGTGDRDHIYTNITLVCDKSRYSSSQACNSVRASMVY